MTETTTEETVTAYQTTPATSAPVRRRRRRGGWVTLLAILLVLGALAVIGDRVAANLASDKLRERIVTQLQSRNVGSDSLEAELGGIPLPRRVAPSPPTAVPTTSAAGAPHPRKR